MDFKVWILKYGFFKVWIFKVGFLKDGFFLKVELKLNFS